jgi:hypothetical protein
MTKKKISPYADEPHVRVQYAIWDMEPPTPESKGNALVPQSLIEKHGLKAAFVFTGGVHHRYMGPVENGPFTIGGDPFNLTTS